MSIVTSDTSVEISGQPQAWEQAVASVATAPLPRAGERALFLGCGTSAFVARSAAVLRESAGHGLTDWAYASELPPARSYDVVVALTRSGTTTEVLDALGHRSLAGARTICVTGVPDAEVPRACDEVLDLGYADEASVVQTRFPTTTLALLRAALGEELGPAIEQCHRVTTSELPVDVAGFSQFTFLGRGWTIGLAEEAALKIRECAQAWAESYPALDFRHGPISVASPSSLVVSLGGVAADLLAEVEALGATVLDPDLDPLVRLVVCQRLAVAAAEHRGLDVDHPRHLTRSVILSPEENR